MVVIGTKIGIGRNNGIKKKLMGQDLVDLAFANFILLFNYYLDYCLISEILQLIIKAKIGNEDTKR